MSATESAAALKSVPAAAARCLVLLRLQHH
jgi:hypothetical protein